MSKKVNQEETPNEFNSSTTIQDDLKAGKIDVDESCDCESQEPVKELTQQELMLIAQKSGTLVSTLLEMLKSTEKVLIAGSRSGDADVLAEISTFRNEAREQLTTDLFEQYQKLKNVLN